jgi:hypothetical protein
MKNSMDNKMMSLYDYLGKAAGPELGRTVHKSSKVHKVRTNIREVSNSKYSGKVTLYPKWFLDQFFSPPQIENNNDFPI